jgi:hypothetical protein
VLSVSGHFIVMAPRAHAAKDAVLERSIRSDCRKRRWPRDEG